MAATLVVIGLAVLPSAATADAPSCQLQGPGGTVSHVVYIQFDNVHFRRDNPNVPSDLEQMPHLLHFLEQSGTFLSRHYTPLVSHTADDLLTSITGLYGDRHGMPEANEYQAYNSDGSTITAGSFAYWTDPIVDYSSAAATDQAPTLVGPGGGNPPAPWVPYTRAGCNFGSVAMADTELENTQPDVANVFGPNSPQAAEANDPNQQDTATTDFEGLSIHCAQGSSLCSSQHGGVPDTLRDEPTGYTGFSALFGSKYVEPRIAPGQPAVTNFDGQPIEGPADSPNPAMIPGFPGYNGLQPTNALAYTLAMQEHGVPVTFTYVSSTHEAADGTQYGPGQKEYVDQLHKYDQDFQTFFERLAADGITPKNTLFVVGSDENDQFVGSNPSPSNCNGQTVFCTYSQLGEIDANVQGLLAQEGVTTPFGLHEDSAPAFFLNGQPNPASPQVRSFEHAVAGLQASNPYTGGRDQLSQYFADPTELKILHMITADPLRTPTFGMFANPNYWVVAGGPNCQGSCSSFDADAWNHGDVQPQITNTWVGMAGPGVARQGVNGELWSDHADIQPTLMALLGLRDDYTPEGRVLDEILQPGARPAAASGRDYVKLADLYKQIDAPVGELGTYTLQASTNAIKSNSSADQTYASIESQLAQIGDQRDQIAGQMIELLDGAAFAGQPIDHQRANRLEHQAKMLLREARQLASRS